MRYQAVTALTPVTARCLGRYAKAGPCHISSTGPLSWEARDSLIRLRMESGTGLPCGATMCLKALYLFRLKIRVNPAPITVRFCRPRANKRMLSRRGGGAERQKPLTAWARPDEVPFSRHDDGKYRHDIRSLVGVAAPE